MKSRLSKSERRLAIAVGVAMLIILAYSANEDNWFQSEIYGVVLDASTNKPVGGAYVLATYSESGGTLFGHSASWCVTTKGWLTRSDGSFRFPITFFQGKPHVKAIKPDHYVDRTDYHHDRRKWIPIEDWNAPDVRIYMQPQDPANPDRRLGYENCSRPKTKKDVLSNIYYMKIVAEERAKYGGDTDSAQSVIRDFESLP
jgi:hypothetical protein